MASSHQGADWLDVLSIGGFAIVPLIVLIVGIVLLRSSRTEAITEAGVRCASV
jgi:hypothetical protein